MGVELRRGGYGLLTMRLELRRGGYGLLTMRVEAISQVATSKVCPGRSALPLV